MSTSGPEAVVPGEVIEAFVRGRLGCHCPADVFTQIAVEERPQGCRIAIGDRLLLDLVAAADGAADPERVGAMLEAGRQERDRRGMNRFRLVLGCADPDGLVATSPIDRDDRVHLHRLPLAEVQGLMARCRGGH